uniref:ERCC4 domain-containing protein n=1 Tax=viral metagenome TaxID=1070528 RepID=A0A6M3KQ23_9ZZZZ
MKFGDYTIEGYENVCAFERKASQLEIYKNLNESHDRIRQAKAFRRLKASCDFPYILIEASPTELLTNNPKIKFPELVCHRLALALAKYGLHALFIPWKSRNANTRRKVGTLMAHIMLACILKKTFEAFPIQILEDN